MGANARSPAAVQLQYSQFTGHCAPRARRPPQSHPRSGRRIPGSRGRAVGRGQARSGGRAVEPGSGGERSCSLPCLPAPFVSAATRVVSNSRSSHSLQTQPRSGSGCPGKRESLLAPGAGASNTPVSTPTLLKAAGEPVNRSRMKNPRQVAPGTVQWRLLASQRGPRLGAPGAPTSSSSHLQRRPESQSFLTPESSGFSFFLTTLRKVISHEAAA